MPYVFGPKDESCMYTAFVCSVNLLSVLMYWLPTERSAPRREAVSTKYVRVQSELSMCVYCDPCRAAERCEFARSRSA